MNFKDYVDIFSSKNDLVQIKNMLKRKENFKKVSCGVLALYLTLSGISLKSSKVDNNAKNMTKNAPVSMSTDERLVALNDLMSDGSLPQLYNSILFQSRLETFINDEVSVSSFDAKINARIRLEERLKKINENKEVEPEEPEEPEFNFDDLTILEKQDYILNTYNINYLDLVNAVTVPVNSKYVDYTGAEALKVRTDFGEIKDLFQKLTEEKLNYVLKRRNLTYEEFCVFAQTVLGETGGYLYDEAYINANSVHNRTEYPKWVDSVNKKFFDGAGYSLYYQITASGQYSVYLGGTYKKFSNLTDYIGYYAILDYLVTEENKTNYASFNYNGSGAGKQLVPGGNEYYDSLDEQVRVANPTLVEVEEEPLKLELK